MPARSIAFSTSSSPKNGPASSESSLLQEAQQAAARLDTRRAARAYGELLQYDPNNTQFATAYFNMALLGRDKDTLS